MSPETILVIALALIFGVLGARLFKIIKIPINYIALGIIGFLVGGELKKSVFKNKELDSCKN